LLTNDNNKLTILQAIVMGKSQIKSQCQNKQ